jgi:hypothetical protein
VACLGGTTAVLAPARTRWVHRRGATLVLPILAVGYALVLVVVALAGARLGATPVALPALCALAGCLTPPLGPTTRAMWSAVAPHPDLLRRAYSLDAAVDEVLFTLGPVVAGFAVALAGRGTGVLLTAGLALVGTLGVAASPLVRRMPPAPVHRAGGRPSTPLRAPGFARLLTVMFGVGIALGGVELVAVGSGGHGASAGTLVATVALGGAIGSVAYGRRTWRRALGAQLGVLCAALTCALLVAVATTASPALLPLALFLSGLAIAPALVVGYGLADRLTDRPGHPEAGALVNTANNLGTSLGTAATALVLDHVGVPVALLIVAAAAAATAVTALSSARRLPGSPPRLLPGSRPPLLTEPRLTGQLLTEPRRLPGEVVTFGQVGGGLRRVGVQVCCHREVAGLLVEVGRGGGVAGQARVDGGQGREAGRRAVGLADRDGPVERDDRAPGEPEQLVVPADDLHPIGLLCARRIGVQGGDRGLGLELPESVAS